MLSVMLLNIIRVFDLIDLIYRGLTMIFHSWAFCMRIVILYEEF